MVSAPAIRVSLLAAFLVAWTGFCADTNFILSRWLSVTYSTDDGLPINSVYGLAQTREGFLWVGHPSGVSRFDGYKFEDIPSTNIIELPDRGVVTMSPARNGGVHLAMDRGSIVSLSAEGKTIFHPEDKDSPLIIDSVAEDSQGVLWVGYREGSLGRIEGGRLRRITEAEGLPSGQQVCSIACDARGHLWFVKDGYVGTWKDGRLSTFTNVPAGPSRLTLARDGGLWITSSAELYKYSITGVLEKRGRYDREFDSTAPMIMKESRDGAVWIGTSLRGLFRYDGVEFESIPTPHPEVVALLEDSAGNIWAGTGGGGLVQVRPRAVELVASLGTLQFGGVQSLCQDSDGVIWVATGSGNMVRLIRGDWETLPSGAEWKADATCVAADPAGGVWIGTRLHGLLRWKDGHFVRWGNPQSISGQAIQSLLVTTNGDVWLGEDNPRVIQRVRAGEVQTFEMPYEVRSIRACAQDAAGGVWFATSKGVLLHFDGDRMIDETARTVGKPQSIRGLCATPDGSLWIAYAGWGVGRIKGNSFSVINSEDGLLDDYISQIIDDGKGWMWMAGNRGLFKVRQNELDAAAEGGRGRVRCVRYGAVEFGMNDTRPSVQGNFGYSPMTLRSRDGRLWMLMRTGLAIIDPSKARESPRPPTVLITRIKVKDAVAAAYGGILPLPASGPNGVVDLSSPRASLRIQPNHRKIEFDYTALSFVGAENSTFRYRLEGLEEDWIETTDRRVGYSGLPAGEYRFRVTACNNEGSWNDLGAEVALVVAPFYWQTWWFRSVVLVAFTLMVIAIVRFVSFRHLQNRLRRLEAQASLHRERARIAQDIHDDLGASLTQISLVGELARQDSGAPERVSEHIDKMSLTARRAIKSLDEIVWAVNPRNDTLAHFIDYTAQYALDTSRTAGIGCRLELPEVVPSQELSSDVRHNVFLVVKEAITNVLKHSGATELRLTIAIPSEMFSICIEDNGHGFAEPPDSPTADGLRNMRQRLEAVGGRCTIQSSPGAGAKITIEISWSRLKSEAGKLN